MMNRKNDKFLGYFETKVPLTSIKII